MTTKVPMISKFTQYIPIVKHNFISGNDKLTKETWVSSESAMHIENEIGEKTKILENLRSEHMRKQSNFSAKQYH